MGGKRKCKLHRAKVKDVTFRGALLDIVYLSSCALFVSRVRTLRKKLNEAAMTGFLRHR